MNIFKLLFKKNQLESVINIKYVSFHITNKCNNRCRHCTFESGEKSYEELNTIHIKQFIDQFVNLYTNDCKFNIYGGEPLVRHDIFDIIEYIHEKKAKCEIATSAVVANEILNRFLHSNVDYICCDLDGGRAESHDYLRNRTGHFKYMIDVIEKFKKTNANVSVTMVVNNLNKNEIIDFLVICDKLQVDQVCFVQFSPTGRGKHLLDLVIDAQSWQMLHDKTLFWYKDKALRISVSWQIAYENINNSKQLKWDCECGEGEKFFLRCDGYVFSCPLLCHTNHMIGNIKEEPLSDILVKRKQKAFHNLNGCPGIKYNVNNTFLSKDPRNIGTQFKASCPRKTEIWTQTSL